VRIVPYASLLGTVLLTVYGQWVFKSRLHEPVTAEAIPRLLFDPWIISAFVAALFASICWMVAVSRLDLSHAYPFLALSFVLVVLMGGVVFHESITFLKLVGLALISAGIVVGSQG
jgi:multidrug transporter EmrE-like cation transporter